MKLHSAQTPQRHGISMRCLLSKEYKIPVTIEGNEVVAYSVNLSSGATTVITRGSDFSFSEIYYKINLFLEKNISDINKNEEFKDKFLKILLHIEQYRDNLYGFYLGDNSAAQSDVLFLQMSYIEHFIAELSALVTSMSPNDLTQLEEHLLNKSAEDEYYSEIFYLDSIYKILRG